MKIKLSVIVEARQAIDRLTSMPLKPQAALQLMRSMRSIRRELVDYDQVHADTVKRLGIPEGEAGYRVLPENLAQFMSEMAQALNIELDLPDVHTVPYSIITSEISTADLGLLEWLFEFDETIKES